MTGREEILAVNAKLWRALAKLANQAEDIVPYKYRGEDAYQLPLTYIRAASHIIRNCLASFIGVVDAETIAMWIRQIGKAFENDVTLPKNQTRLAIRYLDAMTAGAIYNSAVWANEHLRQIEGEIMGSVPSEPSPVSVPSNPTEEPRPEASCESVNSVRVRFSPLPRKKRRPRCFKCRKPFHPGKRCDGSAIACFRCKTPGHKSYACPRKTTPAVAPPSKAKTTGHLDDPDRNEYIIDPED